MPEREDGWYPLGLRIAHRKVVVAGGGDVAERKIRKLLDYNADVLLVSPEGNEGILELEQRGVFRWLKRKAEPEDFDGAALVFIATNDPDANRRLTEAARERRIPVNRADSPEDCDFIVPSSFERGNIQVSIMSSAMSPALSRWLRRRIENTLDSELAAFSEVFADIREEIRTLPLTQRQRAALLNTLLESDIFDVMTREGTEAARTRGRQIIQHLARTMMPAIDNGAEI
jgi:precorrin-2 dehydrogenase / sirohydrochlorin ferrochelatase